MSQQELAICTKKEYFWMTEELYELHQEYHQNVQNICS